MTDLSKLFKEASQTSRRWNLISEQIIQKVLEELSLLLQAHVGYILDANQQDLAKMDSSDPRYDRLRLTESRILDIIAEIKQVNALPSPIGRQLEAKTLPNGLSLKKITVPLGVIGIIYESRPNVTIDVFTLAIKSGNALILKGGSDAHETNTALVKLIHQALEHHQLPKTIVHLLPPDRTATQALLQAVGLVDVIIPRGSQGLIEFVRKNSLVPVIETGAGIVHTYFDKSGDLTKGKRIIFNAKTRRPSVCNSLDCLLVHQERLPDLMQLVHPLLEYGVSIYADEQAYPLIHTNFPENTHPAGPDHFGTEFLSLKLAVKIVPDLEAAIMHIHQYSSKHSEAIIAEDENSILSFHQQVDAAAVYANASTAFTDGNQFGMGAEIGISTQKLHARGPMGLHELTSYKWIVRGDGQIR
jgi:glutamate-5-semialdehyde dehydrogenase